mgnify:CR=1 FL=1
MRNQRGITLIALVITIIVLLILAGVSIAMLTGDNGILSNARKAQTQTTVKSNEEMVKLAVADVITDFYADGKTGTPQVTSDLLGPALEAANSDLTVTGTLSKNGDVSITANGADKLDVKFYGDTNTYKVTIAGGEIEVTPAS